MNKRTRPLRLAHLSDLHFFISEWNLSLFSSHRARSFFSQLHALLPFTSRKQIPENLNRLSNFLNNQTPQLDCILVSGDLTTKGSEKECALALKWLKTTDPIPKLLLPGNHDVFQKKSKQFPFEKLLQLNGFGFSVQEFLEEGCVLVSLPQNWTFIFIDLTDPQIGHAQGLFSEELEKKLKKKLTIIQGPCLVVGHFPLCARKTCINVLLRHQDLLNCLLDYPQVKLYLHGHTHELHHRVWKIKERELLSLDSGCSLIGKTPTWSLYNLTEKEIILQWFQMEDSIPLELGSFRKQLDITSCIASA